MANETNLWVLPEDLEEDLNLDTIEPSDENTLAHYSAALGACEFASNILWALSGRKYHSLVVNNEQYLPNDVPVRTIDGIRTYPAPMGGYLISPRNPTNQISLRGTPVRQILEVKDIASGRLLTGDEYQLFSQGVLQINVLAPQGVEVSYRYGTPPPTMGKMAAAYLAQQFYMLWSGQEDKCRLPDRVTAVTRAGVSWAVLDNQDFLDELKTGVYQVDLFLRAVNPDKARTKAKVFSVDIARGRRRR